MPMFPILEIEEKVQLVDKTRFSGIKSFTSKGETAISSVTITPGTGSTAISVFNSDQREWFTDFGWTSWSFDVDSSNNKIDFSEGSTLYSATIASAVYSSVTLLAIAIQTALNSAGGAGVFTLSTDENDKITFGSTVQFKLLGASGVNRYAGMLKHLGVSYDTDSALNYTSPVVEYGLKKVTLTVNNSSTPVSSVFYQKVYTANGDCLFSSDSELVAIEEDILKWVPPGRSSFLDVHRKAQQQIMDWINAQGYRTTDDKPFTKFDVVDKSQVRQWAIYLALELIFEGNSNAVDDIFSKKSKSYNSKAISARNKFVQMDIDGSGSIDSDETLRLNSGSLFRR